MAQTKKRVYFAHPKNTFNTILEKFALEHFSQWDDEIEIVNPNSPEHQEGYEREGMDYFKAVVQSCDELYAIGFGDNSIGAGIAKEMAWMKEIGGTVVLLPFFTEFQELVMSTPEAQFGVLSVEETRAKLKSYETENS